MQQAKDYYRAGQKYMREGDFSAANGAFMKAELLLRAEDAVSPASPQYPPLVPSSRLKEQDDRSRKTIGPDIYYNLGVGALQKGDFLQAEAAFRRVVELVPTDKEACYNLGVLYEKFLARPKDALKYYLRYVNLADDADADVERVKGWIKQINSQER
ncbi:MAG: tetratricopeptide repeat protein [Candidatus Omnitrophica bacterium]|jgi:tetratricopeptide (TPR) repeat protein|nr:tetratricopeptide repeat protein [Candidatus Omnitrophota bacterium]